MYSRCRSVVEGRQAKKSRSLGPWIKLVLALVGVRLESREGHSSIRVTNTMVILILPGTLIPKRTSMDPRREMIYMPTMKESRVVSVTITLE